MYLFPLVPRGKTPAIKGWQTHSSADPEQIKAWSQSFPGCNWGVDCGKSNICVIDIDVKEGKPGEQSLNALELQNKDLPLTYVVSTPSGGYHLYFQGVTASRGAFRPGIDVKSSGGYVVIPGGELPTGKYFVRDDIPLEPLPDWVRILVGEKKDRDAQQADPLCDWDMPDNIARAMTFLISVDTLLPGERGMAIYKIACQLRDLAISQGEAVRMIYDNVAIGDLAGWEESIESKVANAYTYALGRPGTHTPEGKTKLMQEAFKNLRPDNHPGSRPGILPLRNSKDIRPSDIPRRQWVLGYRLLTNYLSALIAPGAVGKSTLGFMDALAIASGRAITGEKIHMSGNTWVHNAEDSKDEIDMRLAAIAQHYKIDMSQMKNSVFTSSGRDLNIILGKMDARYGFIANEEGIKLIDQTIQTLDIVFLLLDPFVVIHECPENDNMAINKIALILRGIAERNNCAICIVHHSRKQNKVGAAGDPETARGAGALVMATRIAHTLSVMSEKEAEAYDIPIDTRKWYVRMDDAKINMAPPNDKITWFRRVSITLPNGENIGSLEATKLTRVDPPTQEDLMIDYLMENMTLGSERTVLDAARDYMDAMNDPRTETTVVRVIRKALLHPAIEGSNELSVTELPTGGVRGNNKFWVVKKEVRV